MNETYDVCYWDVTCMFLYLTIWFLMYVHLHTDTVINTIQKSIEVPVGTSMRSYTCWIEYIARVISLPSVLQSQGADDCLSWFFHIICNW